MCTEIEAKLKVDSLQHMECKLGELGGRFLAEQLQTDYYFDDADRTLTNTDRCLRLRRQQVGDSVKNTLAYKGPKEKHDLKKRVEIEIEVGNIDAGKKLLTALGYHEVLTVEKKRRLWRLGDCEISLDELPLLGSFVEIEGPDGERIAGAQKDLGLSKLPHLPQSYAALIADKLCQRDARVNDESG
ncbi:MAG: class IV adenylate cyclase [Planctomycetota bacterium]|jgi:adenylate cyclase class 2